MAEASGVLASLFRPPGGSTTAESGFTLLSDPQPAFEARAALIATAERSVDLQYYIWAGDRSGVLLAWRVAEAANRGVRVRILIDDFTTKGHDFGLAAVNAHPNVEVRLFNPYARRGVRGLQMLGDFSRLNHRMHNKALIADGQVAIVGGRNIGDHYFGLHGTANFRDLDVLAAGPVVAEVAASFDSFWNSDHAVPVHAVYAPKRRPLLDRGVELHEIRIDSRSGALLGSSGASLHSKVVVFDREPVFIGSFNLDARSAIQNTELGILIDVPELATRVAGVVEEALAPDTSWRVVPSGKKAVAWRGRNGEEAIEVDHEPGASIWRRMSAVLLGWLPEEQL